MSTSGRWKFFGDRSHLRRLALPFLLGALALRFVIAFAIAPLGDAIASAAVCAVRTVPEPTRAPALAVADLPPAPRRETIDDARDAGAAGSSALDGGRAPSVSDAPKTTIVVPAAVVTRALERRDVSATNATAADGAPLGARLAGVGKYKTGLRDGDVVVTVGGTRTPTVDAMISAAMAVATSGASRISGRIVRGDATIAVVLELPKK